MGLYFLLDVFSIVPVSVYDCLRYLITLPSFTMYFLILKLFFPPSISYVSHICIRICVSFLASFLFFGDWSADMRNDYSISMKFLQQKFPPSNSCCRDIFSLANRSSSSIIIPVFPETLHIYLLRYTIPFDPHFIHNNAHV